MSSYSPDRGFKRCSAVRPPQPSSSASSGEPTTTRNVSLPRTRNAPETKAPEPPKNPSPVAPPAPQRKTCTQESSPPASRAPSMTRGMPCGSREAAAAQPGHRATEKGDGEADGVPEAV